MIAFAGDEELSLRRWLKAPTGAMDPASLVLRVALVRVQLRSVLGYFLVQFLGLLCQVTQHLDDSGIVFLSQAR